MRSLAQPSSNSENQTQDSQNESDIQTQAAETRNTSPTAAIPIPRNASDLEQNDDLAATLVNEDEDDEDDEPTSSRSAWAGLTSMSLGAFTGSGDAAGRKRRDDRNR